MDQSFRRSLVLLSLFVYVFLTALAPAVGQEKPASVPTEPEALETAPPDPAPEPSAERFPGSLSPDIKGTVFVAEEPATLRVWNRKIFVFRAVISGIGPKQRADQAINRIRVIPDNLLTEELWVEEANIRGVDLVLLGVQAHVLVGLTVQDLDPTSDQTLPELAGEVADRIEEVFAARARQRHWPTVLKGLGLSIVATLIFVLFMRLIIRLRTRLARKLTELLHRRRVELVGMDLRPYLRNLVRGTVAVSSWALIVPLTYLWLTFVLRRFPFTQPWGDELADFLVDLLATLAIGALSAIPGLFTVFLIFLVTRFLTRLVGAFFLSVEVGALEVHWLQPETAKATRRLIIVIMWIFALTVAYPYIPGSSSAAFRGVSVFVGLMVSLGATGMVNQIVSGMVIVYTKAFSTGEYVRIGETEGVVEEIGVLSTKISTLRREHITIPNAVLINTSVNNYSRDARQEGAVISTSVTIGYNTPWRQVHALLLEAAARCSGVREEPAPRVLQKGLTDFYVEYTLLLNIDEPKERYVISSQLHGLIQDVFNEHGVQIMSPHYLDKAEEPVLVPKESWTPPPADPETG